MTRRQARSAVEKHYQKLSMTDHPSPVGAESIILLPINEGERTRPKEVEAAYTLNPPPISSPQ
jgi:hypothetical protein